MKDHYAAALQERRAFLQVEGYLLERAVDLFRLGFSSLKPAQMAAISDRLQVAASYEEARDRVVKFLQRQLENKPDRSPWATLPEGQEPKLGEILKEWVLEERYLPAPLAPDLDRLTALRRFWANISGQHAYCRTMNEQIMPVSLEGPLS